MSDQLFDPFNDRLSRDIRNDLSESLLTCLRERRPTAARTVAERYLAGHPVSLPGFERFLTILVRAWLAAQAGLLCVSLLGRPRLLLALSQLGLPPLLLSIVTLMMRYLDVLHDELERMNRARQARSAGDRQPSWWWRAQKVGQTAGCLLVRSLDRGDRVYLAMKSRGYDGRERRTGEPTQPEPREWLLLALAQLAMAAICRPW